MPLREDLLNPIPGSNPSGENLRYSPAFEKIKDARRQDDTAAQGDWKRSLKEADYRGVIKLASEAIATKSKDLQIAAWLVEALVRHESLTGLTDGLNLCRNLIENFWDSIYPLPEDDDLELRAAPLAWIAEYRDVQTAVRSVSLTGSGLGWLVYKDSRAVGYEAECAESEAKLQVRNDGISEGKLTPEEFDAAVSATPASFYDELIQSAEVALQAIEAFDSSCGEKFGDVAPSFRALRSSVEDVQHTARMLLNKKREAGEAPAEASDDEPSLTEHDDAWQTAPGEMSSGDSGAAVVRAPARKALAAEPADREDALNRLIVVAQYLRREDPYSPIPYLILRALRWGELRAGGMPPSPELMEAPPTQIRQNLKRLAFDGQWDQVLEAAERAMGLPCGRAWLDLQRYVLRACAELGSYYDPIALAVRSELRALLTDFPELRQAALMDDTPAANTETLAFLSELTPSAAAAPEPMLASAVSSIDDESERLHTDQTPDAYEMAMNATRSGMVEEAIEILAREIGREDSGRGRFHRKTQLAQICIASRREGMAYPILQELAREIELRHLEEWESSEVVAQPLVLLFQCMDRLKLDALEKQKIYGQICRLDPVQAARLG